MNKDLTRGPVMRSMLWFALPMILGNLLQQCYNIADTLIVGRFLGKTALAAVGSSFSLMTFLTSILLGLCMGSGALFSIRFGQRDEIALKESVRASFVLILGVTLLLNGLAFACLDLIKSFLQVPDDVWGDMRAYIAIVFAGIFATFLYNYFASYLRAVGNSVVPLVFLAVSAVLNIALDLWFVIGLTFGGGFYEGGIAVSVLVLLAELVFSRFEYRILDNVPEINLYMEYSDKDCLENVLQLLRQNRLSISNMEITRSAGSEEHNACAIFALHLKKGCRTEELIQKIQRIEGVVSVEEI